MHKHHLARHNKNVHQKSEIINCKECNKSLQKSYLNEHMKNFHSEEQTQYKCKICTFQSMHNPNLTRHVKNIHKK